MNTFIDRIVVFCVSVSIVSGIHYPNRPTAYIYKLQMYERGDRENFTSQSQSSLLTSAHLIVNDFNWIEP